MATTLRITVNGRRHRVEAEPDTPLLYVLEVPEDVEITLLDRRDQPAVGAGEPAACPVPAAIANAIFDATGARVRTLPFTPARVRRALA